MTPAQAQAARMNAAKGAKRTAAAGMSTEEVRDRVASMMTALDLDDHETNRREGMALFGGIALNLARLVEHLTETKS